MLIKVDILRFVSKENHRRHGFNSVAKHPKEVEQNSAVLEGNMAPNHVDKTEEEEEDPYNISLEDIYDTVDENCTFNPVIQNRPPAPLPRPQPGSEREMPMIFRGCADASYHPFVHLLFIY